MGNDLGLHLGIDATNIRQGGGVTHLSQLLGAADPLALGFRHVTIWAAQSTAEDWPNRPWLTLRSEPWMDASLLRRVVGQQLQMPAALTAEGCDVLFAPGGTLPVRCPVPAVTMSQNMLPFEPDEAARFGRCSPMRLKMRLLRHAQSRSFRRADGIVFLTGYARATVERVVGALTAAIAQIPHGIEPRFLHEPRLQRSVTACTHKDPFRLLYVSILMPYKRQLELAQAVSRLRVEGLPVEVRFVGAAWGNYAKRFRALCDRLDPNHEFLIWNGAEPFARVHELYQCADAFVFASGCENLPNILVEAMAAGLPVASSRRGPMPEVLGNAGIYFDPDDPDDIASSLRQLVQNVPLRSELSYSGWHRAMEFSWRRCADDTLRFIARVARRREIGMNPASSIHI